MRSIKSQNGQNIWDIALKYMGSAEAVFDILKLNPTLRVDAAIATGTIISLPDKPVNRHVADYYEKNNIFPATSVVAEYYNPDWTDPDTGNIS